MDTVVLPVLDSVGCFLPSLLPSPFYSFSPSSFADACEPQLTDKTTPQIHDRITNPSARISILKLRRAIEQAEREVPGLLNVLISEVVDSVEVRFLSSLPVCVSMEELGVQSNS